MDEIAGHHNDRKDLCGKKHLLDQIPLDHQNIGGFQYGSGEPNLPRQQTAEEKQGIELGRFIEFRKPRSQDEAENNSIDDQQKKRIKKRPEKTENGSPITGLQLTADQRLNQHPVFAKLIKSLDKPDHAFLPENIRSASSV
jgi:hypothetical protein